MFSYTLRLIQMLHIRRGHLCYIQIQAYNQQFIIIFLITDYPVTLHRGHGRLNQHFVFGKYIFLLQTKYLRIKTWIFKYIQPTERFVIFVWFEWSFQQPEPDETAPTCRQQGATAVSLGCSCAVLHECCSALLWDFAGYKAKRSVIWITAHRYAES